MKGDILENIQKEFSFFEFSKEFLTSIIDKYTKNNSIDIKGVYIDLYEYINKDIKNEGLYLTKYFKNINISENQGENIKTLNNFTQFLTKYNIEINNDLYKKLINKTNDFILLLETIINSNTKSNIKLLNDDSIKLLDYYYEYNCNNSVEEYIENIEEELDNKSYSNDTCNKILTQTMKQLTKEQEYQLATEYRKTHDKKIRDIFINANISLVYFLANKLYKKNQTIPFEDLVSVGVEGLFRAITDYDPDKASFSTYASKWINQKMIREIQNNSSTIRMAVYLQEEITKYNKNKSNLINQLGRIPTQEEISSYLKISIDDIKKYENDLRNNITSLDKPIYEDEESPVTLLDTIESTYNENPEKDTLNKIDKEELLSNLTITEKIVFCLKNDIYGTGEFTLDEIAIILYKKGLKPTIITSEGVRQILNKATHKLKNELVKRKNILNRIDENKNSNKYNSEKIDKDYQEFLNFIDNIDKNIMQELIKGLQLKYQKFINDNFNGDIYQTKTLQGNYDKRVIITTQIFPEMLKKLQIVVFNKINIQGNKDAYLPRNLYDYYIDYSKEEVDEKIEGLTSKERLALFEFYDMYTGKFYLEKPIEEKNKMSLYNIITKLKTELKTGKKYK